MPKTKQQNIQQTLLDFYNKPVAKVSIELFLSLAAIIFFAIFAIKPTLETMSELVKEIEDKRALDEKMDQKIAALSTAANQYEKYSDQFYLLEDALPRSASLVNALKIIEKLASETDLVVESITLSDVPDENQTVSAANAERKILTFNVDVAGDYLNMRQFVEKIMNSRRMLIVDQVNFSLSSGQNEDYLTARVRINTPYYDTETADETANAKK
jgi:Tfp pilus assembly protein PilO